QSALAEGNSAYWQGDRSTCVRGSIRRPKSTDRHHLGDPHGRATASDGPKHSKSTIAPCPFLRVNPLHRSRTRCGACSSTVRRELGSVDSCTATFQSRETPTQTSQRRMKYQSVR